MEIQARKGSSAALFDLDGRLTAGRGAAGLTRAVETILEQGLANIILDMEQVEVTDCAGIGQLVNRYCQSAAHGGALKLVHVDRRLGDLLRLFRLQPVSEIFATEESALASLPAGIVPGSGSLPGTAWVPAVLAATWLV